LKVLSLFDGISCGQVALERAGIKVDKYFASEINKDSITVTKHNYPNTIHVGDVENLDEEFLSSLPKIDVLIGGSPCQGLSRSKSHRENLEDPRSRLFYNYVDIKNWLTENNNPDLKFLLENVKPNQETIEIMNEAIGCEPIEINSELFSAQRRVRLYWTNIDVSELPTHNSLTIRDIEFDHDYEVKEVADKYIDTLRMGKNCMSYDTSGKGFYSQANRAYYPDGKMCTVPKSQTKSKCNIHLGDNKFRRPHPIEIERLQTLPDNYTSIIKSDGPRMGMVGDGWTVDVIAHIFKSLKGVEVE
jgi:site-specific DNA-cytosine methylase